MVYTLMLVVFVLGYAAIALEHQLKIDKAAAALSDRCGYLDPIHHDRS
jgi:hypothetical protein